MTNIENKASTTTSQGPSPAGEVQVTGSSAQSAYAVSSMAPPPSSGADGTASAAGRTVQRKNDGDPTHFGKVASQANVGGGNATVQAKLSPGNFSSGLALSGQSTVNPQASISRMPLQLKEDRKDGNEEEGQENEAEDMVNIIESLASNDGGSHMEDSKDSNDDEAPEQEAAEQVIEIMAGTAAGNAGASTEDAKDGGGDAAGVVEAIIAHASAGNAGGGAEDAKDGGGESAGVVKAIIAHASAGSARSRGEDRKDSNGEDEGPEQEAAEVISNIVEQAQAGNAGDGAEDSKDDGSEIMAVINDNAEDGKDVD